MKKTILPLIAVCFWVMGCCSNITRSSDEHRDFSAKHSRGKWPSNTPLQTSPNLKANGLDNSNSITDNKNNGGYTLITPPATATTALKVKTGSASDAYIFIYFGDPTASPNIIQTVTITPYAADGVTPLTGAAESFSDQQGAIPGTDESFAEFGTAVGTKYQITAMETAVGGYTYVNNSPTSGVVAGVAPNNDYGYHITSYADSVNHTTAIIIVQDYSMDPF